MFNTSLIGCVFSDKRSFLVKLLPVKQRIDYRDLIGYGATTFSIVTLRIVTFSIKALKLMAYLWLSIKDTQHNSIVYHYADCCIFKCYAECHYVECCSTECHGAVSDAITLV